MLYQGLPENALSKRESAEEVLWGPTEELLAQIVEEVSVLASDRRRSEPRHVLRPYERQTEQREGLTVHQNGSVSAVGLAGMLALTQRAGAVRAG